MGVVAYSDHLGKCAHRRKVLDWSRAVSSLGRKKTTIGRRCVKGTRRRLAPPKERTGLYKITVKARYDGIYRHSWCVVDSYNGYYTP